MTALIMWSSIIGYFLVGGVVAGRVYIHQRLRRNNMSNPEPVFLVLGSFLLWWIFVPIFVSIWSAKRGLTGAENRRLLREHEQAELQRRIGARERALQVRSSNESCAGSTEPCDKAYHRMGY